MPQPIALRVLSLIDDDDDDVNDELLVQKVAVVLALGLIGVSIDVGGSRFTGRNRIWIWSRHNS